LVNLLLERGANVSLETDEDSVCEGRASAFVDAGAEVDPLDSQRMSPLFLTAQRGHLKLVKFFLANALQMEPTCM
jgi:hypothetical protein